MKKRLLAAVLWFYAAWYAGAMVAHLLGVSPLLGPILGAATATIVAGDPRRLIWSRSKGTSTTATPTAPAIQNPA